jgi:hypothetical protein
MRALKTPIYPGWPFIHWARKPIGSTLWMSTSFQRHLELGWHTIKRSARIPASVYTTDIEVAFCGWPELAPCFPHGFEGLMGWKRLQGSYNAALVWNLCENSAPYRSRALFLSEYYDDVMGAMPRLSINL